MRKHYVKELYTEALFELLKKVPYQDISVVDLVKKSGASRASFYRNYVSKDQIVEEYCEQVIGSIFDNHPISADNIRDQVCSIFKHIHEEKEKLILLKDSDLISRIDRYVFDGTINQINLNKVLNNRYQPYFFAGAATALIKAWVHYGFEESPEKMTDVFFRSLSGYMEIDQQLTISESTH